MRPPRPAGWRVPPAREEAPPLPPAAGRSAWRARVGGGGRGGGHGRGGGSAEGEADRGQLVLGQAEPRGGIIVGGDVPAPRIEDPLGDLRPATHRERDLYLPVAVRPLA